mmetsp:Transcript_20333/g.30426  ORF Transcript_20333/g.30426 Transcript_20333/m.30426 type:complete len:378 (-) Transcript_20333:152-1285(-)
MSFFSSLNEKIRSALARAPKTVDAEYDTYQDNVQRFDTSLKRISELTKPLFEHLEGFQRTAELILKEVEILSEIKYNSTPSSKPWDVKAAQTVRKRVSETIEKFSAPKRTFDRVVGISIQEAEKQITTCRTAARFRETARDNYDRARDRRKKYVQSLELKDSRGQPVTQEEKLRTTEMVQQEEKLRKEYVDINQEAKRMWSGVLNNRNDLAFKIFEGVSRMHRVMTTSMVSITCRIDRAQEELLKAFHKRQASLAESSVRKLMAHETFEDTHNSALHGKKDDKDMKDEKDSSLTHQGKSPASKPPKPPHDPPALPPSRPRSSDDPPPLPTYPTRYSNTFSVASPALSTSGASHVEQQTPPVPSRKNRRNSPAASDSQ